MPNDLVGIRQLTAKVSYNTSHPQHVTLGARSKHPKLKKHIHANFTELQLCFISIKPYLSLGI